MFTGLFSLIVAFVIAAIVWYIATIVPNDLVKKLGTVVAVIIAVIGLLNYLKIIIG